MAALAWLGAGHAAYNARRLRRPPADPPPVTGRVAILVPARDEAPRIAACLAALTVQHGLTDWSVDVLDDASVDGTAALVGMLAARDPRVRLRTGAPPPPGWLGKPYACHQLAAGRPDADWLVFVDADVILSPAAVAAGVGLAETLGVDLVSPFPRQLADGPAARLVQPLLAWSWLTLVPLRLAERSRRPSLAVAAGQFLVVRGSAYRRAGGHAAVRGDVLEDLALARAIRRTGGRTTVADGRDVATCRMYDGWAAVRDGYGKSLWAAFGSPAGAAAVIAGACAVWVLPALAALRGSPAGLVGYLGGVTGRAITARRTGSPVWPDALAHPLSVLAFGALTARSLWRRRTGRLSWKGRPVDLGRSTGASCGTVRATGRRIREGNGAGAGRRHPGPG